MAQTERSGNEGEHSFAGPRRGKKAPQVSQLSSGSWPPQNNALYSYDMSTKLEMSSFVEKVFGNLGRKHIYG